MFYNHGIDVRGFAGDTMHMARLLDPSKMPGNYSLSALTKENKGNTLLTLLFGSHNVDTGQLLLVLSTQSSRRICMLLDYLEILVEEFTGVFLIEGVGTGTADFGGYAEDFV